MNYASFFLDVYLMLLLPVFSVCTARPRTVATAWVWSDFSAGSWTGITSARCACTLASPDAVGPETPTVHLDHVSFIYTAVQPRCMSLIGIWWKIHWSWNHKVFAWRWQDWETSALWTLSSCFSMRSQSPPAMPFASLVTSLCRCDRKAPRWLMCSRPAQ